MNIEEKKTALNEMCGIHVGCAGCPLSHEDCCFHEGEPQEKEHIDKLYAIAFPNATPEAEATPHIKDSGERREFDTGAVRDIQEGKGRCDLMPLDVVCSIYIGKSSHGGRGLVLGDIHEFMDTNQPGFLIDALEHFLLNDNPWDCNWSTMFLEVSKHFEEGAKKYGEYNWQKGIPVKCYIDSAVRHYLKWLRGDNDEPHDRAFVWNILCCIWTCEQMPELNDYAKEKEHD